MKMDILKDLNFYGQFSQMKTKEMSAFKDKYLKEKTNGYIYKFVSFSNSSLENEKRLQSLQSKALWFGCPWTMNDPTEFFIPQNRQDFVSVKEKKLFDFQMSYLFEMYNLCSFANECDNYMWQEYGNNGNGFCLCFAVEDFDWFYPVEYVDDKDNYSFVDLWRKGNDQKDKVYGEIPNIPLAYLPYVIKDKINKGTGKNSEREKEIRAIYCTFSEDEENEGVLVPGYKKRNNIRGNNVDWDKLKIDLVRITIGDQCCKECKERLKNIASNMKVKYDLRISNRIYSFSNHTKRMNGGNTY